MEHEEVRCASDMWSDRVSDATLRRDIKGGRQPGGSTEVAMSEHRNRGRQGRASVPSGMQMVVASAPGSELRLDSELALAKSALLYGDGVTVVSPVATMLRRVKDLGEADARTQIALVAMVAPYLGDADNAATIALSVGPVLESLGKKRGSLDRRDLLLRDMIRQEMGPAREELAAVASSLLSKSGFDHLVKAEARGLLRFEDCDPGVDLIAQCIIMATPAGQQEGSGDEYTDGLLDVFFQKLARYLSSGRDYLLFDGQVADLMDAAIRAGLVQPRAAQTSRSAQAMSAFGLMEHLPTFPNAGVDEILDIRDELSPAVVPMRSALVSLTRDFSSVPWDASFADELHDAWVEKVHPAIADLESAVHENHSLLAMATSTVKGVEKAWPGLTIVLAGAGTGQPLLTTAGGGVTVASAAISAAWDRHVRARDVRQRPFYFLYRLQKELQ